MPILPEPYAIARLLQILPLSSPEDFINHPLFSELDSYNRGILTTLTDPPTPNHFEINLLCDLVQIEIPYYGLADTSLGTLLDKFVTDISWIHSQYRIALTTVSIPPTGGEKFSTFTKCKICGLSSEPSTLSDSSLLMSFAKIIELICYTKLQMACGHSHIEGLRYFRTPHKTALLSVTCL